ncbi:alpha/beta hydrolase [Aureibacter tunicatorum]|uniref:Alpha/beta hydrolase n=1 Tax=Aureibacter tunicatorum TaxID=866807 RepID=A0AAE4BTA7_9BACT|nr:alpha/beta hydrolase [Aureibacter tunicatorum]MDR6239653.1 hypothetical protein [Aureibacter tunicatorum]BDD04129.1 alpha/beta hydrolase [Aureibacter tunicatorum]
MTELNLKPGKNTLFYQSNGAKIAGDLYLPEDFDASSSYPAIFFARPLSQVKEQASAVYGKKFAALGYVFFAFEPYNYGDSEGPIRNYESTEHILLNISDGISFLRTMPFVNRDKLAGVGLCMGSMYMTYTGVSDKRLKVVVTISGYLNNASFLYNMMSKEQALQLLNMQAEEKQKYYETGEVHRADIMGGIFSEEGPTEEMPKFFKDAYSYYFTKRAGKETYPAYSNMIPTFQPQADIRLNAIGFAPYFNTPYLGIRGSVAMTGPMTNEFYDKCTNPKELLVVENAGHFDLYDIDEYVDQAINKINDFLNTHLS